MIMSDISGGDNVTNIGVTASTEGVEKAVSELQRLAKIIRELKQQFDSFSNDLPQKLKADQIAAASKNFRQLEREITKVNGALGRTDGAAKAGIAGMTAASRATKQGEAAFKKWNATNEQMGMPIVGRPETIRHIQNNFASLKKSLNDSSKASMVTMGTFRSLEDGVERVGGRGLTSFEQMRVKMFTLNRGLDSLAYNMQDSAKKMQWTGRTMFTNITLPVVGAMAVVSNEFIRFEKQFFQLQRILEFDPGTNRTFDDLREEVKGLAVDMGLGQTAAAQLYTDIGALGVAPKSIEGWAKTISEISAIGDVDLAVATEFFRTTNALFTEGTSQQRLKQTTEIMAQMSAVADETSLQLKDLSDAFPEVAPIMAQMNLSAAEVAASLAGMYKRGIPASEAAHALKFSIQRLLGPTAETERALSSMGFAAQDFADMSGAAFGENALERLAVRLMALPIEDKQRVMGELFGKRQAARMTSWAEDVSLGIREVERAMSDGVIKAEEMNEITSDYARSMIASDLGDVNSRLKQAGVVLEGFDAPLMRFENNVKMFKESPGLQWDSLKAQFQVLMGNIGAIITPTLLDWGKKFADFLETLMQAPPQLLKIVSAMGALAAVFGPVVIALSSFKSVFAGVLKITSKFATRGALRDIMPIDAMRMLEENPYRQDILRVGNKYVRKTGRSTDQIKIPEGATDVRSPVDINLGSATKIGSITSATELTKKVVDELEEEALESAAAFETMSASGVRSAAAIQAAHARTYDSLSDLTAASGAAQMNPQSPEKDANVIRMAKRHSRIVDEEMSKVAKANRQDLVRKSDASRLFGSADDAKRSGQLQGMTWGRWFGKNADESIKGWRAKTKRILSAGLTPRGIGRTIGNAKNDVVASGRGAFNMARDNIAALGPQAGIFSKLKAVLPALKVGFSGLLIVGFKVVAVVGIIVAVLGTIAVVGYAMFRSLADNWEQARARIQPAIDAVKAAFERIKEAIGNVINAIKDGLMGTLFEDTGQDASGMALSWETAADIVKGAIDAIASLLNWIANIINFVAPVFKTMGQIIGSTIGFIANLFQGNFTNAFWYLVNLLFQITKPIIWILDVLGDIFIKAFQGILGIVQSGVNIIIETFFALPNYIGEAVEAIAGIFGIDWDINISQGLRNLVGGAFDWADRTLGAMADFDLVSSLEGLIDDQLQKFSSNNLAPIQTTIEPDDGSLDEFGDAVEEAAQEGAGDGAGKGASDGLKDAADELLKNFLSVLKPRVRKQMDLIREELLDQFEKAAEARLKVYDDQIAAIDAATEAEEKLLRTEEYIQKKRELLFKRSVDIQNYQRNRALAIYEGRIGDVRELDIEFMLGTRDYRKNISDIERERSRDLLLEERDSKKKRLEEQKQFEQERIDIARKGFEKQLDLIMEYEPRTVGEFEGMMNQLKSAASDFGIAWPKTIKTSGEYYLTALAEANNQIVKEFGWGGERAIMAWVIPFISSEARDILLEKAFETGVAARDAMQSGLGGGGNLGMPGVGGGGGPARPSGLTQEQREALRRAFQNIPRPSNNPTSIPVPEGPRPGILDFIAPMFSGAGPFGGNWGTWVSPISRLYGVLGGIGPQGVGLNSVIPASIIGGFSSLGASILQPSQSQQLRNSVSTAIGDNVIRPAEEELQIQQVSRRFFAMGQQTIQGFAAAMMGNSNWGAILSKIDSGINLIAVRFALIGPRIIQSLGPFGAQLSLWFAMQMTQAGSSIDGLMNAWMIKFMNFASKVIDSMGSFGPQMALWFAREMTTANRSIESGISSWTRSFAQMSNLVFIALSPLGPRILSIFQRTFMAVQAILPPSIAMLAMNFNRLGQLIVASMRGLGGTVVAFLGREMEFIRKNVAFQVSYVASAFSSFGQQIVNAMTGSSIDASGAGAQLGKSVFNTLVNYLNNYVLNPLKWFKIPDSMPFLGGQYPFLGMRLLSPVFHKGGVVGAQMTEGKEVMATLQSGEGVLPISAMKKIGPQAFEMLRKGSLGEVVAMAAAGKVMAYSPRVSSMPTPTRTNDSSGNMGGGDVYINVDTFIGQEQWFKSMADKYDMKVTAKKARANGSQTRVISSYNNNERNTYR